MLLTIVEQSIVLNLPIKPGVSGENYCPKHEIDGRVVEAVGGGYKWGMICGD